VSNEIIMGVKSFLIFSAAPTFLISSMVSTSVPIFLLHPLMKKPAPVISAQNIIIPILFIIISGPPS